MKNKKPLLSVTDPLILDEAVSPFFKEKGKPAGFISEDFRKSMGFARAPTDPAFFEDKTIALLEKSFQKFCESAHSFLADPPTIPRLIHFIWLGSDLPHEFQPIINSWRRCHPHWEIKLWTDKEVEAFSWTHTWAQLIFEEADNLAEKSDILRYEILYQQGGLYSDIDVICLKSFNDLTTGPITFFAGQETNLLKNENGQPFYLCNALFGASKGHPLLGQCLEQVVSKAMAPNEPIFSRSGQALLTRVCQSASVQDDLLVLPCGYFYPLPFFKDMSHKALTAQEIEERFISPESMTLHLWAATWYA